MQPSTDVEGAAASSAAAPATALAPAAEVTMPALRSELCGSSSANPPPPAVVEKTERTRLLKAPFVQPAVPKLSLLGACAILS
eukprot:4412568-Prymnesium_polylepis.1